MNNNVMINHSSLLIVLSILSTLVDSSDYVGYVVKIDVDKVFASEDFENIINSNWSLSDTLHVVEDGEGKHVLQPEVSMTGDEWGTLSRDLELPGSCPEMARLGISFRLLVRGYNQSLADSVFFDENPGLKIFLTNLNHQNSSRLLLTEMTVLETVEGEWSRYQLEIIVTQERRYKLELMMTPGMKDGNVLQLDDVKLEYAPVLGSPNNMTWWSQSDTFHIKLLLIY